MNNGWIKLHRRLKKKWYYNKPHYISLWVHILLSANHEDTEVEWNGKKMLIKRGSFITGRHQLSRETGIKPSTLERTLENLEIGHEIGQQKTTKYRIITALKWDTYQQTGHQNGQQMDNRTDTDKNNTKNYKNISTDDKSSLSVKNNKTMLKYNETASSDSYETVIDAEENEVVPENKSNLQKVYKDIIKWAENRRGKRFMSPLKQMKALKTMREADYTPDEIKQRWIELEGDKFYKERGLDFMSVASSFDKKPIL